MDRSKFFFAIPLRPRPTAKDWSRVCKLLNQTLLSALRQDDSEFSIMLACNEVPEIAALSDPRVVVLPIDAPLPTTLVEQMKDKQKKKRAAAAEIRSHGGGYIMFLDADDLVSRRLVSFVRSNPVEYGYLIDRGYHYSTKDREHYSLPHFHRRCGSCAILRFAPDDLPVRWDDPTRSLMDLYPGHNKWREHAASIGRPLTPLPFHGAVHVIDTGENWSENRDKKRFADRLREYATRRKLSASFVEEFGAPAM